MSEEWAGAKRPSRSGGTETDDGVNHHCLGFTAVLYTRIY